MKILIVEDSDPKLKDLLSIINGYKGCHVITETSNTYQQTMRLLMNDSFDLIILDMQFPITAGGPISNDIGFQVLDEMNCRNITTPVILYSSVYVVVGDKYPNVCKSIKYDPSISAESVFIKTLTEINELKRPDSKKEKVDFEASLSYMHDEPFFKVVLSWDFLRAEWVCRSKLNVNKYSDMMIARLSELSYDTMIMAGLIKLLVTLTNFKTEVYDATLSHDSKLIVSSKTCGKELKTEIQNVLDSYSKTYNFNYRNSII